MTDAGARIRGLWARLSPYPGGPWLFTRVLGLMAPYTGTIGARVRVLEPGHAVVDLRDRRRVRNHLNSIHAMALANLGEMASGLAALAATPPGVRGILTGYRIAYVKKARGRLTAECRVALPAEVKEPVEVPVGAEIRDAAGDVVARVEARWRLGPVA